MLRVSQIFHQIIGGFFQVIEHIHPPPLPPRIHYIITFCGFFHINKIGIRKRVEPTTFSKNP